ncbi:MAG: STAS domain-containing protein [Pseudomonadota bacterium]|nr:STAS domain-containing protein [Pseudomonadota bacterium]MDP2353124.1 STAS domain-containing protein [Pseudomonadota bacterium]
MFSFFRKGKPEDLMAFLKEGQPEFASGPAYMLANADSEASEEGIEVSEAGGGLVAEFEEAAVLYANGKVGEAAALLNRYLLDHPDNRDPLPWYMLFDLYEASNQPEPFEDAAVDFAVKFEHSPPTWAPRGQLKTAAMPVPLMSFGEKFGNIERVKLQRFMNEARVAPFVRIEVSKCPAPGPELAAVMFDLLSQVDKMRKPVELIGGPGFAVRLGAAHQGGRLDENGWLLWLCALRLLGKEADFEDTAVGYAVTFEVSPPSYTPPLALPTRGGETPGAARQSGTDPAFHLSGIIGPGTESQLAELARFAEGRKQLDIDLSQVTRIDFAAVGLLLETLINLAQGDRKIQFVEGNEMVNTLLKIVGSNQFAAVLGRTRV